MVQPQSQGLLGPKPVADRSINMTSWVSADCSPEQLQLVWCGNDAWSIPTICNMVLLYLHAAQWQVNDDLMQAEEVLIDLAESPWMKFNKHSLVLKLWSESIITTWPMAAQLRFKKREIISWEFYISKYKWTTIMFNILKTLRLNYVFYYFRYLFIYYRFIFNI